jgi:hypothetical protein
MSGTGRKPINKFLILLTFCLMAMFFWGCGATVEPEPLDMATPEPTVEPEKHVKVTFQVNVPSGTSLDLPVYLHVIDDVTGISFNAVTYEVPRTSGDKHTVHINVPINSMVKYRYSLGGRQYERNIMDEVVKFRCVHAYQQTVIEDTVVAWEGHESYDGNYGRVNGLAYSTEGEPIQDLIVTIAGMKTRTDENGFYQFEVVPIGIHNLVAYNKDGSYQVFQQLATVGTLLETKANLLLDPAEFVRVVFILDTPDDELAGLPVRMIGNFSQFGGGEELQWGGVNVAAAAAPMMARGQDGRYRLDVMLPVGAEIHYKYTLGDAFWSAEQRENSHYVTRKLFVPEYDTVIEETVESWNISEFGSISIITTVPAPLNKGEVWIQYKFIDWMEPIPMWQVDDQTWFSVLTSPLQFFGSVTYRYCLDGDCDMTPEVNPDGYLIQRNLELLPEIQNVQDEVYGWRVIEE